MALHYIPLESLTKSSSSGQHFIMFQMKKISSVHNWGIPDIVSNFEDPIE